MSQNSGNTDLIVTSKHHKKPTKLDLVYFDESPDYCVEDVNLGNVPLFFDTVYVYAIQNLPKQGTSCVSFKKNTSYHGPIE